MQRAQRAVFPPKPDKKRVRGVQKPMIGFRVPSHLQTYIEKVESRGYQRSEVVVEALEVTKDAGEVLGDEWFEIERRAKVEEVSVGTMLGRLAKLALKSKR